ncbi:serine hydrolase domain-containing protein [Nocardia sp. NPDC051756]|uniref:serine hydrolase domain-containing protein n=1 Tax=Nocardia sp. NPDC051756 TaxID=3154751 RepID=UPI00343A0AB6
MTTEPKRARTVLRLVATVIAMPILLAGVPATATPDTLDGHAIAEHMNAVLALGATGIQVRIHYDGGDTTASAGAAVLGSDESVPTDGRFRIASITKMFVATVVLQLVDERRLALDDLVDRYLPQFGLDSRITIRMLLNHTSGVANFSSDVDARGIPYPELAYDFDHQYRPEELVRYALSKSPLFTPGTRSRYANTNYVLAAMVIETVTGTPYEQQIADRILQPLELRQTVTPHASHDVPDPHAHAYMAALPLGSPLLDVTLQNPTYLGASGEMISTTADLVAFLEAVLGGQVLAPDTVDQMLTTQPVNVGGIDLVEVGYGLGMMRVDFGDGCVGFGHDGLIAGYASLLFASADRRRHIVISVTGGTIGLDPLHLLPDQVFMSPVRRLAAYLLCG